ncbi:hypothetical protein [Halopelagius longus]|uniref:Uncharacterized protein n=1 Tax=Halopelagius longus TaxID=1236180 RepID=A0A1H0Y5M2_9EURY|nr:hypothetical protein [Halopelagius longus]RDI72286.1 hypothetical protein DWB78_11510 [Halopelagius longus]SDQ10360.1 hypothetical protein SAMN05216278_0414 [Halopelagius longus]
MAKSDEPTTETTESIHREYILDVRIVAYDAPEGRRYRFEAPEHRGVEFEDPEMAELYADVYFDVNGFEEAGTGERGVPPEVIQAGRDTLAAYFLTQPGTDVNWVASFYGVKPVKVEKYVSWVRERATEIREGAAEMGET